MGQNNPNNPTRASGAHNAKEKNMKPETFKTRRQSLRLTQKALAAFLKLSPRQIIRYEMGNSDIPGPLAILIDILVNRRIPRLKRRKRRPPA